MRVGEGDGGYVPLRNGQVQEGLFYDQLQLSHPKWWTPVESRPSPGGAHCRHLLDRAADGRLLVHAVALGVGLATRP